jgi:ABC-2 type transport system permease protein
MLKIILEVARKDIRRYMADKRSLLFSFLVPIAIASFFASISQSQDSGQAPKNLPILVVDEDHSAASKQLIETMKKAGTLAPTVVSRAEAEQKVKSGDSSVAMVLPEGFFGKAAGAMTGGDKPELTFLSDPSQKLVVMSVRGLVLDSVMKTVVASTFGGTPSEKSSMPFEIKEVSQASAGAVKWSGTAHAFSGMAVQGLFFFAIEIGMTLMRERKLGIWNRLKAAPVPASTLLLGSILSSSLRALVIMAVIFGFGALVFNLRVQSSYLGFGMVMLGSATLAATFGLLIASLGKTEEQSRQLSIFAVLSMSMLGGAWFPLFVLPTWVQAVSLAVPVRWAVDGFDAMTWRDGTILDAAKSMLVLFAFSLTFGAIAIRRMRYEAM